MTKVKPESPAGPGNPGEVRPFEPEPAPVWEWAGQPAPPTDAPPEGDEPEA